MQRQRGGVGSAPNLRSARLAHACTRVRATFERVACCFRVAFQKGNPKRAPIPRFEKEVGEPFNAVGSLALWSLKDPPRATRFLSPPPPFLPLPLLLPFLVLFYSPLFWILARRFCILLQVRRDRVSRLGRMVYAEFARYLRILFGENIVCPLFQINIVLH